MPTNQALQVFYGTIPLILIVAGYFTREQLLMKDLVKRVGAIEATLRDWMPKIERRLTTLETRAGVIYHE